MVTYITVMVERCGNEAEKDWTENIAAIIFSRFILMFTISKDQ